MTIVILPFRPEPRYNEQDLLELLDQCGISPAEVETILNPYHPVF